MRAQGAYERRGKIAAARKRVLECADEFLTASVYGARNFIAVEDRLLRAARTLRRLRAHLRRAR